MWSMPSSSLEVLLAAQSHPLFADWGGVNVVLHLSECHARNSGRHRLKRSRSICAANFAYVGACIVCSCTVCVAGKLCTACVVAAPQETRGVSLVRGLQARKIAGLKGCALRMTLQAWRRCMHPLLSFQVVAHFSCPCYGFARVIECVWYCSCSIAPRCSVHNAIGALMPACATRLIVRFLCVAAVECI